ncbi:hypothetical protein [Micromonospora schwarzwaldensis]|uniref:hypothetical protein n=1 Tax=Micromonospora sp. DSM 45708 TaxID=3111767 RepID=UPI0031DAA321
MAAIAGQAGTAEGTAARWVYGDSPPTQPGASTLSATTVSRNPPTVGTTPHATTPCGA